MISQDFHQDKHCQSVCHFSLESCLSNEWIKIKDVLISTIQDFQVKTEEKSRQNAVAKFLLVIQNYQERK